jgi:uncharacterized OB-fold protein
LKIKASKCSQCGKAIVPPRSICPYCGPGANSMEHVELSNKGVVLSYTMHHMPPEGFEAPLLLALVKLDSDAVVLCKGNISDANRIKIDQNIILENDESGRFRLSINE